MAYHSPEVDISLPKIAESEEAYRLTVRGSVSRQTEETGQESGYGELQAQCVGL